MKKIIVFTMLFATALWAQPAPREIAPPVSGKAEVLEIKSQVRIYRIVIYSENGAAGLAIMRERLHIDSNGKIIQTEPLPIIRRELKTVAGEFVTDVGGKSVTLDQVLGLLNQFVGKWSDEDGSAK